MKKNIILISMELLVAGITIYFSVKLFLLYFFFTYLWLRYQDTQFNKKNMDVTRFILEIKTLLIMKKLNVSEQDCIDIETEYSNKNPEAWEIFQKNLKDIGIIYEEEGRIIN